MQRHERLESDVRSAIYNIIAQKLKNPLVTGMVSVTAVKITKDLKYAKVYVSIFNARKENVLNGLNESSKFIRSEVAKSVKMRNTPELTFVLDDSIEYGAYMDNVIKELNNKPDEK